MSRILGKLLILATLCGWGYAAEANGRQLTVFAAASTKGPMDEIVTIAKNYNIEVTTVYAGSSLLARQIENGAPADVFISAHPLWIDRLNNKSIIKPQSITAIASNKLVLIVGKKTFKKNNTPDTISPENAIKQYLQPGLLNGFLAVADPSHVPAGMYAKEALTDIGLWDDLQDKLARTLDVTAALALVVNGEAPIGIVYASDVTDAVVMVSVFNNSNHSPIIYTAAAIKHYDNKKNTTAMQFIDILKSDDGKNAFIKSGFTEPTEKLTR
ncbi:MAG: molybdate ABC transporter substrate-binding protein [Rhodospirillaceae bacterium]|nr:molybdate ABC transporter substrate-binding protein [Rhodospirillaceae bacterium]